MSQNTPPRRTGRIPTGLAATVSRRAKHALHSIRPTRLDSPPGATAKSGLNSPASRPKLQKLNFQILTRVGEHLLVRVLNNQIVKTSNLIGTDHRWRSIRCFQEQH